MGRDFPHLKDTKFPNIQNVNVYGYRNDYDFSRFDTTQMKIKLCNVPWDLGSVHVGLKEIPMGNVVGWESKEQRDKYLDSLPGYEFDTRYRSYHDDDLLKVPLPYDVALGFNYAIIDYSPVPNADNPVNYESAAPLVTRWLYFIRDCSMESVNTTSLAISRDTWSMFVNDIQISHMILERGHAPISKSAKVEDYLQNPIDNNEYLLAPDVNFGVPSVIASNDEFILNDEDVKCVFISSAYVKGSWGGKHGKVPGFDWWTQDGSPAHFAFAIDPDKYSSFMAEIADSAPQFLQTVKAVIFVSAKLLDLQEPFDFGGVSCCKCKQNPQNTFDLLTLNKSMFGYDKKYSGLTKLYTSPYCHIELATEAGGVTVVNVEDTTGRLTVKATASLVFPWLNISAFVNGIGSSKTKTVSFKNVNNHSFNLGGRWYDISHVWDLPTYVVIQANSVTNDFSTHYDRDTQSNNASTSKTCNDASADLLPSNTATTNAANSANTAKSNSTATEIMHANNAKLAVDYSEDQKYSAAGHIADIESVSAAAAINNTASVANAVSGIAINAAAGAATGAVGGPVGAGVGAAIGAASSIASTAISVASTDASAALQISKSSALYAAARENASEKANNAMDANRAINSEQNDANTTITSNSNAAALSVANHTASVNKANNTRMKDAADHGISNQVKQAALMAPNEYGANMGSNTGTTRPQGWFASVVTQSKDAISQTAAQFLRYGYAYNGPWDFEGFNVMSKFSYWKCSDIWMNASSLPDAWVDVIRNYLLMGVTIWKSPEYINNASIYDNERS